MNNLLFTIIVPCGGPGRVGDTTSRASGGHTMNEEEGPIGAPEETLETLVVGHCG